MSYASAVRTFAAKAAATLTDVYPATIKFAGKVKTYVVTFGPVVVSRQQPEHGQGFVYVRTSFCHFPVDPDFKPKLGDRFTRLADETVPEDTDWTIDGLTTMQNTKKIRLNLQRVEKQ